MPNPLFLFTSRHRGASLLQSAAGGSGSGVSLTVTTSAAGFASTTKAGSLLICVVWCRRNPFNGINPPINTPVTSGITWTLAGNNSYVHNGASAGEVAIYYSANSPSIAPAVTTTASATVLVSQSMSVEFSLYEISNVPAAPFDTVAFATNSGSALVPTISATANFPDFVIMSYVSESGGNDTPGAGYTLGVNSATIVPSQTEYSLYVPPGSVSIGFTSVNSYWGAVAALFKA